MNAKIMLLSLALGSWCLADEEKLEARRWIEIANATGLGSVEIIVEGKPVGAGLGEATTSGPLGLKSEIVPVEAKGGDGLEGRWDVDFTEGVLRLGILQTRPVAEEEEEGAHTELHLQFFEFAREGGDETDVVLRIYSEVDEDGPEISVTTGGERLVAQRGELVALSAEALQAASVRIGEEVVDLVDLEENQGSFFYVYSRPDGTVGLFRWVTGPQFRMVPDAGSDSEEEETDDEEASNENPE